MEDDPELLSQINKLAIAAGQAGKSVTEDDPELLSQINKLAIAAGQAGK